MATIPQNDDTDRLPFIQADGYPCTECGGKTDIFLVDARNCAGEDAGALPSARVRFRTGCKTCGHTQTYRIAVAQTVETPVGGRYDPGPAKDAVERCRVGILADESLCYTRYSRDACSRYLTEALNDPDFLGYEYEGQPSLTVHALQYRDSGCIVDANAGGKLQSVRPIAVHFRKRGAGA